MKYKLLLIALLFTLIPQEAYSEETKADAYVRKEKEDLEIVKLHKYGEELYQTELAKNPKQYSTEKEKEYLKNSYIMFLILEREYEKLKGKDIVTVYEAIEAEIENAPGKYDTVRKEQDLVIGRLADLLFAQYMIDNPDKYKKEFKSEADRKRARGFYIVDLQFKNMPREDLDEINQIIAESAEARIQAKKDIKMAEEKLKVDLINLRIASEARKAKKKAELKEYLENKNKEAKIAAELRRMEAEEKKLMAELQQKHDAFLKKQAEEKYVKHEEVITDRLSALIAEEMKLRGMAKIGVSALKRLAKLAFKLFKKVALRVATGGGPLEDVVGQFISDDAKLEFPKLIGDEDIDVDQDQMMEVIGSSVAQELKFWDSF